MFKTLLKILVFLGLYLLVLFRLPSPAISQEIEARTNMGIYGMNTNVTAKKIEAWTNMGIYGGQILDIAIDPADADKIFAGANIGDGLYVTTNGGKSWKAAGDLFKNRAVSAVKIAPSDNDIIWVAHNCRVAKSTDGGNSWTRVAQCPMQSNCQNCERVDDSHGSCISLAIDPYDAQTVYMGTTGPKQGYYAIYKTEDGGKTWTKTNQGNYFDCRVVDIDIGPQNTDILWAVTSPIGDKSSCAGKLYRSGDGGETWENIMSQQSGFTTVVVNPKDSNRVFTGSYSNKDSGIKEHYFDGDKWLYSRPYIPIDGGYSVVLDIAFAPQDPHVLYAAWKNIIKPGDTFHDVSGKISRSVSGGQYWETYTLDYEFSSLAIHPADSKVIFGGERYLGIYKSNDYGQSWDAANNGISSVIVYDVAIDPNDSAHILAGTRSGVYKRTSDKTWVQLLDQETYSLEFHPKYSRTFYAGLRGHLAGTKDGGVTWTYSEHLKNSRINDITIDPDNKDTVYIAVSQEIDYPGRIYKSENGGVSFSEVLVAKNQSGASYDFNVIILDPTDPQHLFAGGGNFYGPEVPGDLWESRDGGKEWSLTGLKNKIVNALLIDPENPETMYAGCGHSISAEAPLYKSTDGGKKWRASFVGIPGKIPNFLQYDGKTRSFMMDHGTSNMAVTDSAELPLYKSTDSLYCDGDTRPVMRKHGISNRAVTDLEFHREDKNVIYASTYGAGVYISPNQAKNWLNLGTPKHNVRAISISSVIAGTHGALWDCTGTGLIEGRVKDAESGDCINLAEVENSMGGWGLNICLEDYGLSTCGDYGLSTCGDYWMVAPACESTVTATAAGYTNEVIHNIIVHGGNVKWVDFTMQSE